MSWTTARTTMKSTKPMPKPRHTFEHVKPCWTPAAWYRLNPEQWWIGKRVRLTRTVTTRGGDVYRKGRIGVVDRKYGGLNMTGRKLRIRRAHYRDLEVWV
jgi:hypothetical protein